MLNNQGYADLLGACSLFRQASEEDRLQLASRARLRTMGPGQVIFRIGDAGDAFFVIAAGQVRISLPTINGREIILADLGVGECFGEVAVLDGEGRSADATATQYVQLLTLGRADLLSFLGMHPDLSLRLLGVLSRRLRQSDERMTDVASMELGARLAKTLLRRAETAVADSAITQGDLAGLVVSSREAINRQLAVWQRGGIVEQHEGRIRIVQPAQLALVAGLL